MAERRKQSDHGADDDQPGASPGIDRGRGSRFMPVTLKQIAEQAEVSVMTVSNVLNNRGRNYGASTRDRVMSIANEMGYRPNVAARATRGGRHGSVALLVSSHPDQSALPTELLLHAQQCLAGHGQRLLITQLPDSQLTDPEIVSEMLPQLSADGLLVNYTYGAPRQMLELIKQFRIPAIWLNCKLDVDCVHPDDFNAGREATEYLIARGHSQIAYVDYSHGSEELARVHHSAVDRSNGYLQAMADAGLVPRIIRDRVKVPTADRLAFTRQWLERSEDRPTAVVMYSGLAETAFAAATLGLELPRDLSIVVFGDRKTTVGFGWVDSMIIPQKKLAEAATATLLEKIASPEKLFDPRAIPFELYVGSSVAPPPAPR